MPGNDQAIDRAGVLMSAVWLDAFQQLIAQYGERLADKVFVDSTNPIAPDGAGGLQKIIGEQESSGQVLAGLLPPGARLVKAFDDLHEFGALGRGVTKSESLARV